MPLAPNDFRSAAMAASAKLQGDLVARRWSACVPAPEEGARVQRGTQRIIMVSFGLFVAGVAAGGVQAVWLKMQHSRVSAIPSTPLLIAGACSLSGLVAAVAGWTWSRKVVAAYLKERVGPETAMGGARAVAVTIENAATFEKLKIKSEDIGILVPHSDIRCLRIEGLACRYIIHAKDVTRITRVKGPNSEAVGVEYAIGTTKLMIAIQPMALGSEVWRQLFRKKSPLLAVVCRGLGVSERDYGV